MAPGIELNLFYSLVPITGVSLLLRSLIQGNYVEAARFFLPVLLPTVCYGALALRWAIDQFQREDVLFREAERFDRTARRTGVAVTRIGHVTKGQGGPVVIGSDGRALAFGRASFDHFAGREVPSSTVNFGSPER